MRELLFRPRLDKPTLLINNFRLVNEAGCSLTLARHTTLKPRPGWADPSQRLRITIRIIGDDGQTFTHTTTWSGGIRVEKHGIERPASVFSVSYWKAGPDGPVPQWDSAFVDISVEPLADPVETDMTFRTVVTTSVPGIDWTRDIA